jgi:hypothetical protein
VSVFPEPGSGTECTPNSPADCGVAPDAPIELRFDRHLLPATAVRQSIVVTTGAAGIFLSPTYDPTERLVVFRPPRGERWMAGVRYTVELEIPSQQEQGWGFRAFDGAELSEAGSEPLAFTFRTRRDPALTREPSPPTPTFADLQGVIDDSGCATAGCHRAPAPTCPTSAAFPDDPSCPAARMGLDLSDAEGFARTALGKAAHEADIGPAAGEAQVNAARFGVGMPIVAAASPGNSYLVYKVLVNDHADSRSDPCWSRYSAPVPSDCRETWDADVQRLRERFVFGAPMPLDASGAGTRLDNDALRTIVDWIAGGAPLE